MPLTLAAVLAGSPRPLAAQSMPFEVPPGVAGSLDIASLAHGPYGCLHTLYERTIFQIDIVTVDICVGPETADRLHGIAAEEDFDDALADSAATALLDATNALTRVAFLRSVPLSEFLSSVRGNMLHAVDAGILSRKEFRNVSGGLPEWFSFLRERGLHDGDRLLYRIRGDTLRTIYIGADGRILLDQTDVGASHRVAVLGGYFAPEADLREGLVRSLFKKD